MSVQGFPRETKVVSTACGSSISMQIDFDTHDVPPGLKEILGAMGYAETCYDPDTNEPLFQISPERQQRESYPLTEFKFKWYEALAYEFANFISIGNT